MSTGVTAGVYITEKSAGPLSVMEVPTAVPAFVGHTEKGEHQGVSLRGQPHRIASMLEYERCFGLAPTSQFDIRPGAGDAVSGDASTVVQAGGRDHRLTHTRGRFLLQRCLRHFFENGGGPCYIVSVGDHQTEVNSAALQEGIERLVAEPEPTLLVIPDAMLLPQPECMVVQKAMVSHCGGRMKNRMALLDVWQGWQRDQDSQCIENFRRALDVNHLDFATAYYPWLHTTLVQDPDVGVQNIAAASRGLFIELLQTEIGASAPATLSQTLDALRNDFDAMAVHPALPNETLRATSPLFRALVSGMKHQLNLLPPGAAMAGVYSAVDRSRGVWKAPANVSLNAVQSPAVPISHAEQEGLNVTPTGKSINALRSFPGRGVLVWGARTLDGNSLDWRYVNVRRTVIMIEQSCRLAARAMALAPNEASTWVALKSMFDTFLTGIWQRGGLAGAVPDDAFAVRIGLGESMTAEDVLRGVLRVTLLVAITRPAEFIEITFQQQMQTP
jgi:uncharacterized protein